MAGMPTQEELFDLYRKNNPVRRNVTGMPLGEGFTPYKQKDQTGPELVTGLGSLFNAEGPDALGTMISIPGYNGGLGSGRLNAINSMGLDSGTRQDYLKRSMGSDDLNVFVEDLLQDDPGVVSGGGNLISPSGVQFRVGDGEDISGMEKAYREIQDNAILPRFDQDGGTGNLTQKNILDAEAAEIEALLGNDPVFDDPMSDIAALIEEAQKVSTELTPTEEETRLGIDPPEETVFTGGGRGEINEKPGDRKAYLSNLSDGEKDQVIEDSFAAAMSDYNESAGKAPPKENESKKDALARYKKEFEEATGIDASGKVDKSRALMAFGLALMNNKGGNILAELGVAGEKAMPYIDKARSEARAAQFASGNYALGQQKADVAADRAALQATAGFKKDMYLKWYDSQLQREEDRLKSVADLEQAKIEGGGSDYTKTKDFTFASGAGDATAWKIPVVYDTKSPSSGVILKPDAFARKYIDGRAGVEDALDVIGQMRQASTEIAAGGGTSKFAFDKINSIAKAVFPNLNTGQPSSEQEYAQGVNLLMGRFKRFLTQETGNGISNIDVQIWTNEIMKKPSWFTNADETASALGQLEDIFYAKITEFDQGLEFIYNTDNLLPGDFERMTKTYGTLDQIQGSKGNLILKDGKIVRSK